MSERRLLVPFDFSAAAERALAWAAAYARDVGGAKLRVLHSVAPYPMEVAPAAVIPPLFTPEDREKILAELQVVVARAGLDPSAVELDVVLAPEPGPAVVDAAREGRATLVVTGTHGRTGLKRLVLGSVAEYIVRHAPCPVVTVRDLEQ